MFWLTPPNCEAFCLNHENGVSKAHDQPADMWLYVCSVPQTSYHLSCTSAGSLFRPLKNATSFGVPSGPPSALVPLSPLM
jgi:hypothetical protein